MISSSRLSIALSSQNLYARPGGVRKRRVIFDEIKQLVDAADSLGDDNAELQKMAAKRVDAHRPLFDGSSRVLCSISVPWCSALLTGMKRIPGRDSASQQASASTASFLPRLT